jgi:hypothetical protein
MDRKLEDKMNIALTRDERVLLWNLIGNEYDKLVNNSDKFLDAFVADRLKKLKVLEILIIG